MSRTDKAAEFEAGAEQLTSFAVRRLRILFVSLSVPYPPSNGQRMRNWALLQALAAEGHALTLLSFAERHDLAEADHALRKTCADVQFVPLPDAARSDALNYGNRLRAFLSVLPYGVWRYRSEYMTAAIREAIAQASFDLLICDDVYLVKNLPKPVPVPVLLNKHDITHVILRRYLTHELNPAKLAYGWTEYEKLRNWEAWASSNVAAVLACSEHDRVAIEALCPKAQVAVVPNSIDVGNCVPKSADDGKTILFAGAMDWYPNQDAVSFFISKILPKLQELVPDSRFRIAGRCPPEGFRARFAGVPSVEFTGTVPDMRPEITKAAVCVVPLRIGSGTRMKILEAAAMAKAIVSTRIGAEGLDFMDDKEIILADGPEEFARAIADLLTDPARRRAMSLAARRRVEVQYGMPALRSAIREALAQWTAEPGSVTPRVEFGQVEAGLRP